MTEEDLTSGKSFDKGRMDLSTKDHMCYDSSYTECPEEANLPTQEVG